MFIGIFYWTFFLVSKSWKIIMFPSMRIPFFKKIKDTALCLSTATGNVTRDSLASGIAGNPRRDEMRRGCHDEGEYVSRGCFCTAEVLTQLHERLLAPLLRASVLLLCPLIAPSTLSPFPQLPLIFRSASTHHSLAHEPTLARTLSLSVFHPLALLLLSPSLSLLSSPSVARVHFSLAAHVIPHYFHFIVSNLG